MAGKIGFVFVVYLAASTGVVAAETPCQNDADNSETCVQEVSVSLFQSKFEVKGAMIQPEEAKGSNGGGEQEKGKHGPDPCEASCTGCESKFTGVCANSCAETADGAMPGPLCERCLRNNSCGSCWDCHAAEESSNGSNGGGEQEKGKVQQYNFRHPDPNLLVWDTNFSLKYNGRNVTMREGWLKVPLVHDPHLSEMMPSPDICLRVRGVDSDYPKAPLGSLFLHCGGPSSGRDCVTMGVGPPKRVSLKYDQWSISQRGIASLAAPPAYLPPLACPFKGAAEIAPIACNSLVRDEKEIFRLLGLKEGNPVIDEVIKPLIMNKGLTAATQNNETFVHWYYHLIKIDQELCYKEERYQLKSADGKRSFNTLDYAGTMDLVNDLEVFRSAIGASKISMWGMSYGTSVVATYATVFPHRIHRMVLDANVPPYPDIHQRATEAAMGGQSVWDGIATECGNSYIDGVSKATRCPAAPDATMKALTVIHNRKDVALADNLGRLISSVIVQKDVPFAATLMACVESAYSGTLNKGCSGNLLPSMRAKPPTNSTAPPTDNQEPNGLLEVFDEELKDSPSRVIDFWGISTISAIVGLDVAGRVTNQGTLQWWKMNKDTLPFGLTRGLVYLIGCGTWPAQPRPTPPFGSANVKPLIVGNLYDLQTSYESTQWMREQFQQGILMTWQGYGHCLSRPVNRAAVIEQFEEDENNGKPIEYTDEAAKFLCAHLVYEYLETGAYPLDGHTCKRAGPMNLSLGAAVELLPRAER